MITLELSPNNIENRSITPEELGYTKWEWRKFSLNDKTKILENHCRELYPNYSLINYEDKCWKSK